MPNSSFMPLSASFLFEPSERPCVVMDVMNTLIDSDTLQLRDARLPALLETLRVNGFTLILLSASNESITRGVLKDLVRYFDFTLFQKSHRDLVALGKSREEMLFLSSNFSKLVEEWHLPLDVPVCDEMIQIFTESQQDLLSFSSLTESHTAANDDDCLSPGTQYNNLANRIFSIRSRWNAMRNQIHSVQKQLVEDMISVEQRTAPGAPVSTCSHSLQMKYAPPSRDPLLPPTTKEFTIVLDLDGTLVHTNRCSKGLNVNIRPYARHFLKELAGLKDRCEVILFTAASRSYAEPIVRHVDTHGVIDHILHRSHCSKLNSHYIKELNRIGRQHYVIVDDNQFSFLLNHEDAIPVKCWVKDDTKDDELLCVLKTIKRIYRDENLHNSKRHIRKYLCAQRNNSM